MIDLNIGPVPGTKGHTRGSWRDTTCLRGVLLEIVQDHPNASDETLAEFYLAKVAEPWKAEMLSDLLKEAAMRCFDNDLALLRKPARAAPPAPAAAAAAKNEAKAKVTDVIGRVKKIVLLDLVQPNGKKLRNCSFGEGRKFSGWLNVLADKYSGGDDNALYGDKVSEADAAAAFAGILRG